MIKEIVKDIEILSKKCIMVSRKDPEINNIIQNLIDTANFHEDNCVGLAANQIGYDKRIIIIKNEGKWLPMINPNIINIFGSKFISKEGCLSLEGERETERHFSVLVMYQNQKMKCLTLRLSGTPAVIVQHEIDHLYGKII